MSEPKTSVLRKGGVFARVLLFLLVCPVILVLTNPIASKLAGPWSEFAIGLGTAIATLLLTLLFVRWEGLRLSDVGAQPLSVIVLNMMCCLAPHALGLGFSVTSQLEGTVNRSFWFAGN